MASLCEVRNFGSIRDFHKVQEYFGLKHDENWLNAVNTTVSPTGELIALAQGEKLAFLSLSWDNVLQVSTYALSWCGEIEDPNQIVTSVICLPMHGENVSSGAEWTCVVLGLSSGMLLFYTDAGTKIFSQMLQEDPVVAVKCFSPDRRLSTSANLYVVYNNCVCIMKGSDVYQMLTNCRHNYHRFNKRCLAGDKEVFETTGTIQYQKFNITRDRETILNDAVAVEGIQNANTYDHIVEQAVGNGCSARVSEMPMQRTQVVGVGAAPYLGFYYAEEGYKTISLSAVAKDVIGVAYKNLFGSIFGRSNEPEATTSETTSSIKEIQMRSRCRLYDGKRDGFTIALSPGGQLAAVTDNLDRIMLIDTQRAVILRVWKGYHDAQCGFLPVKEKSLKTVQTHRRCALFLVIYAPRLGCLEIWALQHGPRIAAFTVTKSGQLIYSTHNILTTHVDNKAPRSSAYCCLFLDSKDGSVKEIQIPFHYSLSEGNSQTSRDIYLLRKLRNLLREIDYGLNDDTEALNQIAKLASDFQTIEVRQQCLELLKKTKQLTPNAFRTIIYAFDESLKDNKSEISNGSIDDYQNLLKIIINYKRLVDFYIAMKNPKLAAFEKSFDLDNCDLVIINQLILLLNGQSTPQDTQKRSVQSSESTANKVTFKNYCKDEDDFIDYITIFKVGRHMDRIQLDKSKVHLFGHVSGKLFSTFYNNGLCCEEFKTYLTASTISCDDLLELILYFWLEKGFIYQNCDEALEDMSRLAIMLRTICELAGDRVNANAYNAISPWWQKVREMLLESPKTLGSLYFAIVCKFVAKTFRLDYKEESCDEGSANEEDEHWERITHDEAQWSLLIGKLEDVAILGAILHNSELSIEPIMPAMLSDIPECSLKFIVNGGKGIVTELTAQWLINSRIHPSKVLEDNENINKESEQSSEMEIAETSQNIEEVVLHKLALLRKHFPYSLESGVLLSLMAWNYMVYWSKHLHSLEHMRAALTCLEQFRQVDWALKHGICCMLWNATLKYPLQLAGKLFQKVGHLPSDKMCRQELDMPAANIPTFLSYAYEFLEHFTISLEHEKRELQFEESLVEGQLPVQFLALQQHNAINDLLQLQKQLCSVIHLIAFFQLKVPKPLTTLFDAMSNRAFYLDINKEMGFALTSPDLSLQQQREEFLCIVVAASIELIREDMESLYVRDHVSYMERINTLADAWGLEKTALRRRQIVEMYAHGYDEHGEVLLARSAKANFDVKTIRLLLEVAGRRLQLYATGSQMAYLNIASVGQTLLQYLDKLHENTQSPKAIHISATEPSEINLAALTKLVNHCCTLLSQSDPSLMHIAAQMFDACSMLQSM